MKVSLVKRIYFSYFLICFLFISLMGSIVVHKTVSSIEESRRNLVELVASSLSPKLAGFLHKDDISQAYMTLREICERLSSPRCAVSFNGSYILDYGFRTSDLAEASKYNVLLSGKKLGQLYISPPSVNYFDVFFSQFIVLSGLLIVLSLVSWWVFKSFIKHSLKDLEELAAIVGTDVDALNSYSTKFLELNPIKKTLLASVESIQDKTRYEFSRRVAHDIRSPLETMQSLIKGDSSIEASSLEVLKRCLGRVVDIANCLLEAAVKDQNVVKFDIKKAIKEICEEKLISWSNSNVVLSFRDPEPLKRYFIKGDEVEFSRAVSNLLNNSFDATCMGGGVVDVILERRLDCLRIKVTDDGKGMSPGVLARVRSSDFSTKYNGNGIGLSQVKDAISSLGGALRIESGENEGTSIEIKLPEGIVEFVNFEHVVLIDDDKYIRMNWIHHAQKKQVNLLTFSSWEDFKSLAQTIRKDSVVCIDSSLPEGVKGEVVSKDLSFMGFSKVFLTTGYTDLKEADYPWIYKVH